MSDIITFSDPKFTQIKYESGERILLSNADSGIAIFEIIFLDSCVVEQFLNGLLS